ncbi:MAG: DUF4129 domain-containing protein [Chloroflexi bacterium]|nr:DUF4129 domain-containing protein [Chloroflexota bacterium]MCI0576196.1 DUF4129 domain-containing protein [Chloroflexota bacterium]MCI0645510.1 DUF4129 domain-containing protein [Chloroflexota bacterium]MCI0730649.1 DUF4129 domain-containing protein [Chloroflexota bacterium]
MTHSYLSASWNFLRHELLYVSWASMEVALLTPVALAFMPWARLWSPAQVAAWLLLLMLLPFNLSRLMSLIKLPVDRQQIVMVGALLFTVVISLRSLLYETTSIFDLSWLGDFYGHLALRGDPFWVRDVTIFVFVCLAWWRGLSLIGRHVDVGDVGLRFRVLALLSAPLIAGVAGLQLPWPVTPFIFFFFLVSLVAIALTRVEQLELERSGLSFPLRPAWLLAVVGAAVAVILASGVLTSLASGQSIVALVGWISPIWLAMRFTLYSAFAVISYLSTPLIIVLSWLVQLLINLLGPPLREALENLQPPATQQPFPLPEGETGEIISPTLAAPTQAVRVLGMLFIVLLVSLALNRLFRRARRLAGLDSEQVKPEIDLDGLGPQGLVQRLLNRLGLWQRWRAAASIRRIYRAMCALAEDGGYPRATTETPTEYLAALAQAWPEHTAESRLITAAYNRVRYGEIPETAEELAGIAAAWKQLSQIRPSEQ